MIQCTRRRFSTTKEIPSVPPLSSDGNICERRDRLTWERWEEGFYVRDEERNKNKVLTTQFFLFGHEESDLHWRLMIRDDSWKRKLGVIVMQGDEDKDQEDSTESKICVWREEGDAVEVEKIQTNVNTKAVDRSRVNRRQRAETLWLSVRWQGQRF